MVTALIFAGGTGERMNSKAKPKQFLELHGKPIIIHTIEHFEEHPLVDDIVIVCIESWIKELRKQLIRNSISKIKWIVPGGSTGQESIYNGLNAIKEKCNDNTIVIIHDGVRPLITKELITENINSVKQHGSAVTVAYTNETITTVDSTNKIDNIPDRNMTRIVKAPQTFYFKDIWGAHQRAKEDGITEIIDSATLMKNFGFSLNTVISTPYNIKITTPSDYYIFRAIYEAQENSQILGL